MIIKVGLEGMEPGLMMNSLEAYGKDIPKKIREKGIKSLNEWVGVNKAEAQAWMAETSQYRSEKSGLHIPLDVISGCFLKACSGFKVKVGSTKKSANAIFPAVFFFREHEIPLLGADGKRIDKYTHTISKFVRVPPRTGARVPKTWAGVYPWTAEFSIDCGPTVTLEHLEVAQEVFTFAGLYVGIMDGRPSLKRFNYGRFKLSKWDVIQESEEADLEAAAGD